MALDVGNTNLRLGMIRGAEVTASRSAPTPRTATPGELETVLDGLLADTQAVLGSDDEIVLVSVVPAVTEALSEICARRSIKLIVAGHDNVPLPIRVDDPAEVGSDRLVNALAAARLHGTPAIVVDLGTATTFDVVGADGAFVGGAIAPGLGLGLETLAARTAQLPRVAPELPERPIGGDTVSAIQSGTVLGHIGMVTFLLRAISAELAIGDGTPAKVVLTGGLSVHPWAKQIPGVDAIDPLLTLRGLAILHAEMSQPAAVPR